MQLSRLAQLLVVTCQWISELEGAAEASEDILYVEQSPDNVTTFLGRIATFRCLSHGNSYIFWFANGSDVFHLPDDHNISSFSTHRNDGERGENSTLSVVASQLNNFTSYTCGLLDLATNQIVNYSSPAILLVQGRPLPPSKVRVSLEDVFDDGDSKLAFFVTWSRSSTLFDQTSDNKSHADLLYTVYGYYYNVTSDLFYLNTTIDLSHIVHRDAHDCRVKTALFSVSAEIKEVGEGAMSEPESSVDNSRVKICPSSKQNHVTAVVVGVVVNIIVLTILVVSIIVLLLIIRHYRRKIYMKSNSAYEVRSDKFAKKKTVIKCHPNSAYDSVEHNTML